MAYEKLESLRVYQEAVAIGETIWEETLKWNYFEKDVLGKQLARAADSISANIAESYDRTGSKEVVNFLIYARGSLYETKDHLSKALRRKLIAEPKGTEILNQLEHLAPALNAYITAKRKSLVERNA